jgi:hypothetical protein
MLKMRARCRGQVAVMVAEGPGGVRLSGTRNAETVRRHLVSDTLTYISEN